MSFYSLRWLDPPSRSSSSCTRTIHQSATVRSRASCTGDSTGSYSDGNESSYWTWSLSRSENKKVYAYFKSVPSPCNRSPFSRLLVRACVCVCVWVGGWVCRGRGTIGFGNIVYVGTYFATSWTNGD